MKFPRLGIGPTPPWGLWGTCGCSRPALCARASCPLCSVESKSVLASSVIPCQFHPLLFAEGLTQSCLLLGIGDLMRNYKSAWTSSYPSRLPSIPDQGIWSTYFILFSSLLKVWHYFFFFFFHEILGKWCVSCIEWLNARHVSFCLRILFEVSDQKMMFSTSHNSVNAQNHMFLLE